MKKLISAVLCAVLLLSSVSALAITRDFGMVKINEVMASNGETIDDSKGKSCDWIELWNASDDDIDLSGLNLSDGKKNLAKFTFPEGVTLAKGAYMIIFCSDYEQVETLDGGNVEIHVPFKLSADGEKVVISYQDVILDIVRFDQQTKDVSYALKDDGTWAYCDTPTPGAENKFE
ncbi:MAG: lamin tail domain-containing protein [Clostridia bacterium]|nr:lamin tail domain-containing protein [Clostridia bacterium]MBQ6233024.1 lamin tail domain-containing protein [Clostridia bacterium]